MSTDDPDRYDVRLYEDPAAFLAQAGTHLAADPVLTTVVSTVTQRALAEPGRGAVLPNGVARWWAAIRRGEDLVGAAMRTAPFAPWPLFVLPMPDAAAIALARRLHARGEEVGGVNGALPAAQRVAEETARLVGGRAEVDEHTRLFVLGDLVEPRLPPGRLRLATPGDVDLALAWFRAFEAEADAQAGREPDPATESMLDQVDHEEMERRVRDGRIWLWEDERGEPVHLTAANPPAFGVARIGPVFTPREHRGRGYASAAVAAVSRLLRDEGVEVCLFTDQANPVSNRIYQALGYRPVVDMANLLVRSGL